MTQQLSISIGQYSDKGRKAINQDFHAARMPHEPQLSAKGIVIALADGISSSEVSQFASEASIKGFLEDYYSTSESWTVKTSVQRVLTATNSWLYSQTRNSRFRYTLEKGYVCTFSTLVVKSNTAHIFHVGDTRVYRVQDRHLEQLTEDHCLWVPEGKSYLRRALGMREQIDIDYRAVSLEQGDIFILATDGVYEFTDEKFVTGAIQKNRDNLDQAAELIIAEALQRGSNDNLTIQIVRIDTLPPHSANEVVQQLNTLPFPPELRPRMQFDGYEILRELHMSHRSHIYLAEDKESGEQVVLKIPAVDLRSDAAALERFLMEEWVARRINNAHVVKPCQHTRKRNYLYIAMEYIEGQSLGQWMRDNSQPDLETVRTLSEQIAAGLRALHRQEMLHQDLRPDNIMIDRNGTVRLIDFGSTRVAGLSEINTMPDQQAVLGTAQYSAPEYFLGETGSTRSDQYSLGAIVYQMLSGKLPYGPAVARATSRSAQRQLRYQPLRDGERSIPAWVDDAICKAVHPNPAQRYAEISEFIHDLRHPNQAFLNKTRPPLIERNPVLFWKGLSLILFVIILLLLVDHPAIK
ncbi:MAG: bifunctional protein-serine/threonine kinase/phosphatase [Gammaproteobacteria bacterium]|nr:bifunctional protein-serine/threonine kinase/phosphatase [Gammaproteobacteria bacterium]MDH5652158.1 bifunctional protein-serine/threonine kinase/phosphatase [Gammaproteobacteria bacterium]